MTCKLSFIVILQPSSMIDQVIVGMINYPTLQGLIRQSYDKRNKIKDERHIACPSSLGCCGERNLFLGNQYC